MGAGIAIVAARAGFSTIAYDVEAAALERARRQTEAFLTKSVERRQADAGELEQIVGSFVQTTDLADLGACDLVIEAVFEDLATKQKLLKALHEVCPEKTIFASNTSTLSITEIASGCGREDRVVGMHFCLPAQLMKLIELSPGLNTSQATFETAWSLVRGGRPDAGPDRGPAGLHPECAAGAVQQRRDPGGRGGRRDTGRHRQGDQGRARLQDGPLRAARPDRARHPAPALRGVVPGRPSIRAPPPRLCSGAWSPPATSAARRAAAFSATRATRCSEAEACATGSCSGARAGPFRATTRSLPGASADGEVVLYLGAPHAPEGSKKAILVELGSECLGVHTGEGYGDEGSNVLGFARYRNGADPPSNLIELVVQPKSDPAAIEAARAVFEAAGLEVVISADQAGRILDRLLRPVYNAALRLLDEGLASAAAIDTTCRLGLGYPDGPIERVMRGGLAHHHDVTKALFEVYGTPGFAPARRAVVAKQREGQGG